MYLENDDNWFLTYSQLKT